MRVSENHILRYLVENQIESKERLHELINKNAKLNDITSSTLDAKLSEMRSKGYLDGIEINESNSEVQDKVAYILWGRNRGVEWDTLLKDNCVAVFKTILQEQKTTLQEISTRTSLSQPTVSKYIKILRENNFVRVLKKRPLTVKPRITDVSLWYINLHKMDLQPFNSQFPSQELDTQIDEVEDLIAKIHIYSTTVTEGNSATEEDVEKLLGDINTGKLSTREVIEIINTHDAIDLIRQVKRRNMKKEIICALNREIVDSLRDDGGKIQAGQEISVSNYRPPANKLTVMYALEALENFSNYYMEKIDGEVLGAIVHFLFVSIHPFGDGNGRVGRLIHSWMMLKDGKTFFVYDPKHHQEYFNLLDTGREEDLTPFIEFCIEKHHDYLQEISEGNISGFSIEPAKIKEYTDKGESYFPQTSLETFIDDG